MLKCKECFEIKYCVIFAKRIKHGYLEKHNQYGSPKLVMDTGLHKAFDSNYPKSLQHIRDYL